MFFFQHLIDILEEYIFDVFIAHSQTARLSSFAKRSPITSKIHPRGERLFRKQQKARGISFFFFFHSESRQFGRWLWSNLVSTPRTRIASPPQKQDPFVAKGRRRPFGQLFHAFVAATRHVGARARRYLLARRVLSKRNRPLRSGRG